MKIRKATILVPYNMTILAENDINVKKYGTQWNTYFADNIAEATFTYLVVNRPMIER